MNIKLKNISNPHGTSKMKQSEPVIRPLDKTIYKERPLNNNSSDLSFKGLSTFLYKQTNDVPYNAKELLAIAKKTLGSGVDTLYNHVKNSELTNKLVNINEDKVTFHKKTIPHLIYDSMLYPIKILPGDILNGAVSLLARIKPLKNWAEKTLDSPTFKKIRQRSKIESEVNSLRGLFETISKLKKDEASDEIISSKLIEQSAKMFDKKTGNYDTKHERSLNRIVSGSIPAFFLANDAYNLSMMCNNNKKEAKKERKIRFRQEVSRVGVTAYLTLITMGALQKHVNNSKLGVMLMTGSTVLFTEMFSRLTNGKHIIRLSSKKAKEINAKNGEQNNTEDKTQNNDYKNVFFRSTENKKTTEQAITQNKKGNKQEPLMNFGTIMKASGIIIGAGFAIKGLRTYKWIDDVFKRIEKPLKNMYKQLTVNTNNKISEKDFNEIIEKLKSYKDNNEKKIFEELANKYSEIAQIANKVKAANLLKNTQSFKYNELVKTLGKEAPKSDLDLANKLEDVKLIGFTELKQEYKKICSNIENEKFIYLGSKDGKAKLVVDFVIAPFEFIADTIKLPYTLAKKAVEIFEKKPPTEPKDIAKANIEAFAKSIERIGKEALKEKYDDEKFKSFVNDNIMKSFNVDNMSNVPNSELANLAKTSATAATIWFLMTDNYNMVMLKSNGEDKEGAQLKSKERFVQEGSRLFYQTLLINLFNGTFRSQYNGSLGGMSWVTAICTYLGENLTRKSVGMPVKPHTREELLQIEKKKEESTGFTKTYYDFMSKLTGKKSLSEAHEIHKENLSKK